MVLLTYAQFGLTPALRDYPITGWHVLLAALLSLAGGLLTGALGLRLTRDFETPTDVAGSSPQGR
jgi:hypothetical protein